MKEKTVAPAIGDAKVQSGIEVLSGERSFRDHSFEARLLPKFGWTQNDRSGDRVVRAWRRAVLPQRRNGRGCLLRLEWFSDHHDPDYGECAHGRHQFSELLCPTFSAAGPG